MFRTIDDYDLDGKRVLVRADLNSPVDNDGKLCGFTKLEAFAKSLRELSEKNTRTVVIAHQGRKGKPDFISLKQHSKQLSNYILKEVKFVDDIIGENAIKEITSLENGEILLLENVRFLEEEIEDKTAEEHSNGEFVRKLAPLFDFYINDAFPSCHRSHASIVGFSKKIPSIMGRLIEKELNFLDIVIREPEKPIVLMIGGSKPKEPLMVIKKMISDIDKIVLYGAIGNLFLVAKDYDLGDKTMNLLRNRGHLEFLDEAKNLVFNYDSKLETPIDFAFLEEDKRKETTELPIEGMVKDIGEKTIEKYSKIILGANTVILKGPAGVYEEPEFQKGTRKLFEKAANVKFSLVGGGHTTDAIEDLEIDKSKFTHVSLSGGAFIEYLAGKKLPGVEALKN